MSILTKCDIISLFILSAFKYRYIVVIHERKALVSRKGSLKETRKSSLLLTSFIVYLYSKDD